MGIERDDTQRPDSVRSGVRDRPGDLTDASIAELRRQLAACNTALNGADDNHEDTGLKGEVQHLREEVRSMRSIQIATLVLVVLVLVPIAARAVDGTGRDWGWWSPAERVAQVRR